jgi:hypothetical protein
VEFSNGHKSPAWLISRDPLRDLAALPISVPHRASPRVRSARDHRLGEVMLALRNLVSGPLTDAAGRNQRIDTMIDGSLGCAITSDVAGDFLRRFHHAEAA